jgi:hypothetical protein
LRKLHKRPERLSWICLKRGLLVAFLAALTWLMVQQARQIAWSEVMASVRAYSWATLLTCSALAVTSLTLYSCYDLLGRRYSAQATAHNTRTCAGCAANHPKLLASEANTLCKALPSCYATGRSDGRNVVWIEQGQQS